VGCCECGTESCNLSRIQEHVGVLKRFTPESHAYLRSHCWVGLALFTVVIINYESQIQYAVDADVCLFDPEYLFCN